MARISFVLFFTLPPLLCLTPALLRDLQPFGGHSLSSTPKPTSVMMARAATENEPASNMVVSLSCASTISSPRPPPPMNVAKVALATTCTAEVRMPAKITGAAIGSCMRVSTWPQRVPSRACRVYDVSAHLPQARRRIDEDGGYRQGRERDERRVEAEAEEGLAERQDGERWDSAPYVADVDGQRRAKGGVPYRERHGQRDSDAEEQGGREEDVLPEQLEEVGASKDVEYPDILCPPARPGPQVALQGE